MGFLLFKFDYEVLVLPEIHLSIQYIKKLFRVNKIEYLTFKLYSFYLS
jgi:hypothetical protein